MKTNPTETIIKLSKKRLNVFDVVKLYNIFSNLSYQDIDIVELFFNNYYGNYNFPEDFYKAFLYYIKSDKYKTLLDILLTKNIYSLISFIKGDNYLDDISDELTPREYYMLSIKSVNGIVSLIEKLDIENNETTLKKSLSNNFEWKNRRLLRNAREDHIRIAIKMLMSIGHDNTIDVLNGRYGTLDYETIYYLFNNLNIKNRGESERKQFIDFLFNNKKDSNNNMRMILNGEALDLFINFDYFYNYIEMFIEKTNNDLNRSRVSTLLKEKLVAPKIDSPEINGIILNDMISSYYNKYGINEEESSIIDKNINAYNSKLKTKTKSSIIRTSIPKEGEFSFEILPLSDVRNLVMGYRAGNCFRINGDAFMLFNNFLTNPHMRIMSISLGEHKDIGMVLLMRNGNSLILQGIELSKRLPDNVNKKDIYDAVKNASEYIMNKMNDEGDEIVASIIGLSNENTIPYNNNILPFIINPIIDNNQYYNGIDNYQGLLSLKEGKSIDDIKLFTPDSNYHDEEHIYRRDRSDIKNIAKYREIEKILMSLRLARFKSVPQEETLSFYDELVNKQEKCTICTSSWFITVFEDGTISSYINSDNPIVLEVYNKELERIKSENLYKSKNK